MTAPLIKGASGLEGEELTYASTNENNKETIFLLQTSQCHGL